MAFTSTTQPAAKPAASASNNNYPDALLSLALLTALAATGSKKAFRKLKSKLFWSALKLKFKHFFSRDTLSTRTIIYILLAVVLLALLFINPLLTLALAVIALVVILATKSFTAAS